MKDGNVQVKVKDGQIVKVAVGSGLDGTYARLFEAACIEAQSGTPSIDVGVKVVIFGCVWLEAVCNRYVSELLKTSLPAAVYTSCWNALKNGRTLVKLSVVASFHSADSAQVLGDAKRLFELRNRLVHFKELYTEAPGPHSLDDDLDEWKMSLPETELVSELKPPKLEARIEDIVRTKAWLDLVHGLIFKGTHHKIDLSGK